MHSTRVDGRSATKWELVINAMEIVDTVREPLLVLDENIRVQLANDGFYRTFKVSREEAENRPLYELGNGQWDIKELRKLLEEILPKDREIRDFRVDHKFEHLGQRSMLLNVREINRSEARDKMILLSIRDITRQKEIEENLMEANKRITRLLEQVIDSMES